MKLTEAFERRDEALLALEIVDCFGDPVRVAEAEAYVAAYNQGAYWRVVQGLSMGGGKAYCDGMLALIADYATHRHSQKIVKRISELRWAAGELT